MNLLLITPDAAALAQRLPARYTAIQPLAATDLGMVGRFVAGGLAEAVLLDDRVGSLDTLFLAVDTARAAGWTVLVHAAGPARLRLDDLRDRGARVTEGRDEDSLLAWIAEQLGLSAYAASTTRLVATASAKGGAGKTTVLVNLAEALAACGLRVLLVENDLSNAALRQVYGCGPAVPSYTELAAPGDTRGITPASLRAYVQSLVIPVRDRQVRLDLLLGPATAAGAHDLAGHHTDALFTSVQQMSYDLVLVDTGPEIMRRPTALYVLHAGGRVLVPCPTGVLEREGAVNLLTTIQEWNPTALASCGLIFLEPERGAISGKDLPQIRTRATQHFGAVAHLGVLPRDARAVSMAAQFRVDTGRYHAVLHVAPHSRMARTVWAMVPEVARWLDLPLAQQPPRSGWLDRLLRRKRVLTLPEAQADPESVVVPEPPADKPGDQPAAWARVQGAPADPAVVRLPEATPAEQEVEA